MKNLIFLKKSNILRLVLKTGFGYMSKIHVSVYFIDFSLNVNCNNLYKCKYK